MCFGRAMAALWRLAQKSMRGVRKLLLGRRFIHSLERNQEAADHLDTALKEIFEQQG
ncbi:hypothetical protein R3X27_04330 [Tropicimonas sp. TH_r6]|uniref:hypothetical protein n=1 Tax=Tropicimonas sp. TH_r6 TaxID=3082085 RepID=UPI00295436AA|nr:hypothetical protein [Tropicimonas sp. TH_r6]MDV7141904.1 hypothetical protein [Tropicimonas sp. TH_r6]